MQQTEESNACTDAAAKQERIAGINIQTLARALGLPEHQIASAILAKNITKE